MYLFPGFHSTNALSFSRYKLSLLILFMLISFNSIAQSFFTQTVDVNTLSNTQRISPAMQANMHEVRYVREPNFQPSTQFTIQLTGQTTYTVTSMRWYEFTNNSVAYTGRIEGSEQSDVAFAFTRNRWSGLIVDENLNKYYITQTDDNIFAIGRLDEASFISKEKEDIAINPAGPEIVPNYDICASDNPCDADEVVINIMVVYTDVAYTYFGSVPNLESNIALAVANMNLANSNSGVRAGIQFNLVHTGQVSYTESGDIVEDLYRLDDAGDGYMDIIHTWRNTYQADLVSLIINNSPDACGIGFLNTNRYQYSAFNGFNVTVSSCMVGNYTMAHELGHNMGLRHDYYVDASNTPCAHHHGYVNDDAFNVGAPANSRWRTILAYNNKCAALGGFNCTRLNYWSNPEITYNGSPMGKARNISQPADEVYALNRFACQVASFHGATVLPVTFIHLFATQENKRINVNWQTANESDMSHFEVEMSVGLPNNFRTITTETAKNRQLNNYTSNISAPEAQHIFLRIKSIGNNGAVKYSSIVQLTNTASDKFIKLVQQPVAQQLELLVYNVENKKMSFEIFQVNGRRMLQTNRLIPVNSGNVMIDVSTLSSGYYILRATDGNRKISFPFIKQ